MSLGDSGKRWDGYVTAGLNGQIKLDITGRLPKWMIGHYKFIWSERMLEHISTDQLPATFENISKLLETGAKCRMSLPICFYGTQKVNMVRAGNENNCERHGHVTWFIHEGFGPITPSCFGSKMPPGDLITYWSSGLQGTGLVYEPIRYYLANDDLYIKESLFENQEKLLFIDETEIESERLDSFVFDLVKGE